MTSYLSTLTTSVSNLQLSSRLNSLRRAITSGDEADDPDYEDSSHISKVLRAYYTEKGRPFPPWLPPDPKAPAPTTRENIALASSGGYSGPPQQGSLRGQPGPGYGGGGGGGGLGDLWGDSASSGPSPPPQSSSLRSRIAGGGGGSSTNMTANVGRPSPQPQYDNPYASGGSAGAGAGPGGYTSRPLPSQRAGSIQSMSSVRSGGGGYERSTTPGSAQERLRARLHGGSTSPNSIGSGNSRGASPVQGGYGPPPGQGYAQGGGGGGYDGGAGGYGNSAYGGNNPQSRRPMGLPSGPRPNRQGR